MGRNRDQPWSYRYCVLTFLRRPAANWCLRPGRGCYCDGMDRFPIIPHQTAGGGIECCGCIVAEAFNSPGESKMTLRCNECGLAVGTINTGILNDLVTLALATEMDKFVPDPDHINALPGPLRKYVHDLETRADPAGDVAETAMLKENNAGPLGACPRTGISCAPTNGLRFAFYSPMLRVVPNVRKCWVAFTDSEGIAHSLEVVACSLYEAAALDIDHPSWLVSSWSPTATRSAPGAQVPASEKEACFDV